MKKLLLNSLLMLIPSVVSAYDAHIGEFYFNLNAKTLEAEVSSGDVLYSGDVVIPSSIIFGVQEYVVASIGEKAFYGCTDMTSVYIPSSILKIGNNAFSRCNNLSFVNISDLSAWCRIEFVNYRDSSYGSNPLSAAHHLYLNGEEIKDLVIPDDVGTIRPGAFYGCHGFESVTIYENISEIGDFAFRNCTNMTSLSIPRTVNSVGYRAFNGCQNLSSVSISDIAAWCRVSFRSRYGYDIDYTCNPLYYAHHLYMDGEEIKNMVIPDSVSSINHLAFYHCQGLESVTIPGNVASIGERAFSGCTGLTSANLQEGISTIGESAFNGCSNLTSLTLSEGLTYIDEDAFYGCQNITSIYIPSTVSSIRNNAFEGCVSLTAVNISNLAAWCKLDFQNYRSAFDGRYSCNPLRYAHHLYLNGEEIKDMVIPDTVPSIGQLAFYNCEGLESVKISESVVSIGAHAFQGCSNMKSVFISSRVNDIDLEAFGRCEALSAVHIAELASWCKINYHIRGEYFTDYYTCNPLYYARHLYMDGEEIKDMVIPDSVVSITNAAFYNCSGLTSVRFPYNLISIGERAFWGCDGLVSVYSDIEDVFGINNNTFENNTYNTASLYVPEGTLELYQQANGWKNFSKIDGISLVETDSKMNVAYQDDAFFVCGAEGATFCIYDVMGRMLLCEKLATNDERIPFRQKGVLPVIIKNNAGVLFEKKFVAK